MKNFLSVILLTLVTTLSVSVHNAQAKNANEIKMANCIVNELKQKISQSPYPNITPVVILDDINVDLPFEKIVDNEFEATDQEGHDFTITLKNRVLEKIDPTTGATLYGSYDCTTFYMFIKNTNDSVIFYENYFGYFSPEEAHSLINPTIDSNDLNKARTWVDNELVCVKKLIEKQITKSQFPDLKVESVEEDGALYSFFATNLSVIIGWSYTAVDKSGNKFSGKIRAKTSRNQKENPITGEKSYHYYLCSLDNDLHGGRSLYDPRVMNFYILNQNEDLIYKTNTPAYYLRTPILSAN